MVKMGNLEYDVGERERGKLGWAHHHKKRDREIRGKCGDRDERRGGLRYREIAPRQPPQRLRSGEINWERGKLGREIARRQQHEGVRCERNLSRREIEWDLKHRDRGRLIFQERDREIYGRKFEKISRREIVRQKEKPDQQLKKRRGVSPYIETRRYQAPCEGWKRKRRGFSPHHEKRYKFSHEGSYRRQERYQVPCEGWKRKRRGFSPHHEKRYKFSHEGSHRRHEQEVENLKRYRSHRFIEEEEDISTSEESRSESGSEAVVSRFFESSQYGKIANPDSFQLGKLDYPDKPPPFDWEKYNLTRSRREPEFEWSPEIPETPGPPETPRPPQRYYSRRELGFDGKHWSIMVDRKLYPCPYPKRKDRIIVYLKVLAQLLGNKERALKSIYAVQKWSAGCRLSGKVVRKSFSMKGVSISLDQYIFVNGEVLTGKYCKDDEIFPLPGVDNLDYYRRELDRAMADHK